MRPRFARCARAAMLALACVLAPITAAAQEWRGEWSVADATGLWVLSLGLAPGPGGVEGLGRTHGAGIGAQDNAPVIVTGSTALPYRTRLALEFRTRDGRAAPVTGALVIYGEATGAEAIARLIVAGQSAGFVTLRREAPQPPPASTYSAECLTLQHQQRQAVLTGPPEAEAQIRALLQRFGFEAMNPVGLTVACAAAANRIAALRRGWEGAAQPPACARIDRIVERLGRTGTTEERSAIAVLLRLNDLQQRPRRDAADCRAMLTDLTGLGLIPSAEGQAPAPADPTDGATFGREPLTTARVEGWGPAYGGNAISYWSHNTSGMAWEVGPGTARHVWYWAPRDGLAAIGVARGTLLFDGVRRGDRIEGTARIFTASCGAWTYRVSGPVTDGDPRIVLRGNRPLIGADCRVTGTRPDTLLFTVVAADPFQVAQPETDAETPEGGLWAQPWRVRGVQPGDWLNFRAGPSTRFEVLDRIPRTHTGLTMQAAGCDGVSVSADDWSRMDQAARYDTIRRAWCQVSHDGQIGWVYGRYIEPM